MALKKSLTRKVLPPPGEPYIYIFLLVLLKKKTLFTKEYEDKYLYKSSRTFKRLS